MGLFDRLRGATSDTAAKSDSDLGLNNDSGVITRTGAVLSDIGKGMAARKDAERRSSGLNKGAHQENGVWVLEFSVSSNLDKCKKLFKGVGFKFKYGNYNLIEETPNKVFLKREVKDHGSVDVLFTSNGSTTICKLSCPSLEFVDMLSTTLKDRL